MHSVGVTLLAAPADGIPPSFLLSLKPEQSYLRPVEYLFNVPCAYSRLVLEHRARPGLGLRAIFATGVGCHALVRLFCHAWWLRALVCTGSMKGWSSMRASMDGVAV